MNNSSELGNPSYLEVPVKRNSCSKDSNGQRSKRVHKFDGRDYSVNFSKITIEETDRLTRSKTRSDPSILMKGFFPISGESIQQQTRQRAKTSSQVGSDEWPKIDAFSEDLNADNIEKKITNTNVDFTPNNIEEKSSSVTHFGKRDILLTSGIDVFEIPLKRNIYSELPVVEDLAVEKNFTELDLTKDLDQMLEGSIDPDIYLSSLNLDEMDFNLEIMEPDKEIRNAGYNMICSDSNSTLSCGTLNDVQLPMCSQSMNQCVNMVTNVNKPSILTTFYFEQEKNLEEHMEVAEDSQVPKIILNNEELDITQKTDQPFHLGLTDAQKVSLTDQNILNSLQEDGTLTQNQYTQNVVNQKLTQSFTNTSEPIIPQETFNNITPFLGSANQGLSEICNNSSHRETENTSGLGESLRKTILPCCDQEKCEKCSPELQTSPLKTSQKSHASCMFSPSPHTNSLWHTAVEDFINKNDTVGKTFSVSGGSIERVFSPALYNRQANSKYPGISIASSVSESFLPSQSQQLESCEEPKYKIELVDTPPPLRNYRSIQFPEIIPSSKLFQTQFDRSPKETQHKIVDKPKRGRRTRVEMELYREEKARKKQNEKKTDMELYIPNYFNDIDQRRQQLRGDKSFQYPISSKKNDGLSAETNQAEYIKLYPSCSIQREMNHQASGSATIISDQPNVTASCPASVMPIIDFPDNQLINNFQHPKEELLKGTAYYKTTGQVYSPLNNFQTQNSKIYQSTECTQKHFKLNQPQQAYPQIPQQINNFQQHFYSHHQLPPNNEINNFKLQETFREHHKPPNYTRFQQFPQPHPPPQHFQRTQSTQAAHNPQTFLFPQANFPSQHF